MATTTVTGTIRGVNNTALANKWISFRLVQLGTDAVATATVAQSVDSVQTDANGDFSVGIWNNGDSGKTSVLEIAIQGSKAEYVIIPTGVATIELWDLIENYQADGSTSEQVPVVSELFLRKSTNLGDVPNKLLASQNLDLEIGVDVQAHSAILDATTASFTTTKETAISTNTADIASNNTDIGVLTGAVVQNETDIATNVSGIATNVTNIATNVTNIATNVTNIATNAANITSNDGDITTLQGRVTAAEGNITSNDGDITTLQGRVTAAEGRVTRVVLAEGNITSNDGDITALDGRVTTAEGDITTVEGDITTLAGRVTTAEGNITSNIADIATNVTNIALKSPIDNPTFTGTVTAPLIGAGSIDFNPGAAGGELSWNNTEKTLNLVTGSDNVTIQVGQEVVLYCRNTTGLQMTDGQVVKVVGSQGNNPTIALAQADTVENARGVIGVVTQVIDNNSNGFVSLIGKVRDLTLDSGTYTEGDLLYLSSTVAGGLTLVRPDIGVEIGRVIATSTGGNNAGIIEVSIDSEVAVHELEQDVIANTAAIAWGLTEVWLEAGTLSETLDSVGSQKAKVIETIGADPDTPTGYSLASKQESDFEGFQTNRFTFLKNDVQLSKSEDEVGSENAITEEWFNPDPANTRNVKTNYSLARKEESDVDGIPTKRFTFLKDNVELSRSEDLVGSQKAIVTEVFKPAADPTETGYVIARTEVSDVDGIPTKRFTFLRDGAVMSESRTSESDGVFQVTKVFFNNAGVTVGPIIAQRTDDVDGIPTISITTLQDVDGNSIVAGGENLVNQVSGFSPFSYPGVLDVDANLATNGGGGGWLQVKALLIDAPAQCKVKTTTYFIFQTANSIVASDYKYASSTGLWSPNHWAAFSISASGVFEGGLFSDSSTFRGYRTSSPSYSGSVSGPLLSVAQLSWQGRSVLTDDTMIIYNLVVDQGPPNPIGNTYTLDVQITPAFDDIDGNQYYKKTIVVTDAIPSQPNTASLPYA
jgi:hypothetical protein